jgi:hypothetical protein
MWELIVGSIAFALFLSLLSDFMLPKWLTWIIAGLFAYGLICWT